MDDEERFSRYRYLLQPIRDLNEHLDDNIEEILGLYLEKLRNDRERNFLGDDGEIYKFNFSEAAVLLQSSFQLFSKKVDRLYDQVQEACHGTTTKKKGRKAGNAEQNEDELAMKKSDFDMEVDTADLARNMVDVAWLLEQGKKKENKLPVKVGQIRTEGQRDRLVDLPISFMPTKKTAPSKHFLKFEQNNDTIFVRQDELFSFSSCAYASNNAEMMTVFMNIAYKSIMNDHTDSLEPFRTIFNQEEEDETQLQQQAQQAHFELDPIELGDDDYYMGGDGGDDMGHQQSVSEPLNDITASQQLVEGVRRATDHHMSGIGSRPPSVMADTQTSKIEEVERNYMDKIEFLDDFIPVEFKRKPLQTGTSWIKRSEKQLEKRNKVIENKLRQTNQEDTMGFLGNYVTSRLFSRKLFKTDSVFGNLNSSLRSKQVQALNHVLHRQEQYEARELKRRKEAGKEQERLAKEKERGERSARRSSRRTQENLQNPRGSLFDPLPQNQDDFGAEPDEEEDANVSHNSDEENQSPTAILTHAIEEESEFGGVDDIDEDVYIGVPTFEEEPIPVLGDTSMPNNNSFNMDFMESDTDYAHFIKEHPMLDAFMEDLSSSSSNNIMQSILKYWNRSDSGLINNKGKKQIQEWNNRIAARLAEEETHKPFDIHAYGTEVIDKFGEPSNSDERVGLMSMMRGSQRYEKSRYLLATLILANCGNVDIKADPPSLTQSNMNTATVKLLSRQRHHEVFADEQRLITGDRK